MKKIKTLLPVLLAVLMLASAFAVSAGAVDSGTPGTQVNAAQAPAAPAKLTVGNITAALKISWTAVSNVDTYRVYRREIKDDGTVIKNWKSVADVKAGTTVYTDNAGLVKGTRYQYCVRCIKDGAFSPLSVLDSAKYLCTVPAPEKIAAGNITGSLKISWSAVSGAEKYRVYRREIKDDGTVIKNWVSLADVKSNSVSYIDKNSLVKGTRYQYCVRTIINGNFSDLSPLDSAKYLANIAAPTGVAVSNSSEGLLVKWNAVAGADGFRVYKRIIKDDGTVVRNWAGIKNVAGSAVSYMDSEGKDLVKGTRYQYCVRTMVGDQLSALSNLDSAKYLASNPAPANVTVGNSKGTLRISWSAVSGADKYRVYRREIKDDGTVLKGWTSIADVKVGTTSYTDKYQLVKDTRYQYCVRAVTGGKFSPLSTYDSAKYLAELPCPEKVAVGNVSDGLKISWSKVPEADGYCIYKCVMNDSMKPITDWELYDAVYPSTTSYVDTFVSSNVRYGYMVTSVIGDYLGFEGKIDSARKA